MPASEPTTGRVLPIAEGEDPWTEEEIDEVSTAERALAELFDEGSGVAGRDPADIGSTNFERNQEMSLVQNARDMLEQAQWALRLFDLGQYGWCESCGQPIGKDRLSVFPRATMCVTCKQREERR
jgi:DnaK suppressor protein